MRGTQQSRQLHLTIYNLFTLKPSIQSHTPYTQTRTSLTVIQTFSHIHHTHKLVPLSQSYIHSVTYTIHIIQNLSHSHTDIQSHTPYTQTRTSLTVIQPFSHIHSTHNLVPLSQSYRHSVTYIITYTQYRQYAQYITYIITHSFPMIQIITTIQKQGTIQARSQPITNVDSK